MDGPAQLAIRRHYIEERYRLLPYLYAVAEESARTGDPVMRPTFYDYPQMQRAPCDQSMAFTVGADLLVAASRNRSRRDRMTLPPGEGWYDYWTGARAAGEKFSETPRLDRLPVFVRPGAIIPKQPLVQSTGENPNGSLQLEIYPGDDCRGEIYLDDGIAFREQSLRQKVSCTVTAKGVSLHFSAREGSYRPWWKSIAVKVHGPREITKTISDQPSEATILLTPA